MKLSNRPAYLAALLPILVPSRTTLLAQDPPKESVPAALAAVAGPDADAETSEFGDPLVVNGKRISDLEIKRYLIYGPGQSALNSFRIDALIRMERAQRVKNGTDPKSLDLPDDVYKQTYDREITNFQKRFPTLDVDTEVGRAYRSIDLYKRQLHQTLQFDWIFFPPGPPADWSDLTKEAVNTGVMEGQDKNVQFIDLIADAQDNWQRRKEYAEQNGAVFEDTGDEIALRSKYALGIDPEDEMFAGLLRDYVVQTLGTLVETKTASDGLPEDIVMTVEGPEINAVFRTDEIYEVVRPTITAQEISDTRLPRADAGDAGRARFARGPHAQGSLRRRGRWHGGSDEEVDVQLRLRRAAGIPSSPRWKPTSGTSTSCARTRT
jgi:hypothetical protein